VSGPARPAVARSGYPPLAEDHAGPVCMYYDAAFEKYSAYWYRHDVPHGRPFAKSAARRSARNEGVGSSVSSSSPAMNSAADPTGST